MRPPGGASITPPAPTGRKPNCKQQSGNAGPPTSSSSATKVETRPKKENKTGGGQSMSHRGPSPTLPPDFKQQLLTVGPGNYLSRSQDCLSGHNVTPYRRKGSAGPALLNNQMSNKRPQSSLGLPKVASTNGIALKSGKTSPCTPVKDAGPPPVKTNTLHGNKPAARRAADVRINKTKMTVTELQKVKQELEIQLSEMSKKADSNKAEIATLKMELRKNKQIYEEELERLKQENDSFKRQIHELQLPESQKTEGYQKMDPNASPQVDVGTSPVPIQISHEGSSSEELADCSEGVVGDWDRQSSCSEVSFACLQDRINQMEETHYCTTEELQATLQELTDLQDIVDEMTNENIQLDDDKQALVESLYSQSKKLDHARLQIENLKYLLLSSSEFRSGAQTADRHQKLVELLKSTHEEYEDLKCKYFEVRQALTTAQEENQEHSEMIQILKNRNRLLDGQMGNLGEERKQLENKVLEVQRERDKDRRETFRLTNLYEKERCRIEEFHRQANAGTNKTELEKLLEGVRREKDKAEERISKLQSDFVSLKQELDLSENHRKTVEQELTTTAKTCDQLREQLVEFERARDMNTKQLVELRASALELDEKCKRQTEDKKEYKANMIALQQHNDELQVERNRFQKELTELNQIRKDEEDDWKQFQSDLQTAVVVANDFKMEAQGDIEQLANENSVLRDKVAILSADLDRLRLSSSRTPPSRDLNRPSSTSSTPVQDVKSKIDEYIRTATSPLAPDRRNLVTGSSGKPNVSSVRALIESLESSECRHQDNPSVTFRASPSSALARSPPRPLTFVPSTVINNLTSEGSDNGSLSKSSSNLASRPSTIVGVDVLAKRNLKTAVSYTEVQALPVNIGSSIANERLKSVAEVTSNDENMASSSGRTPAPKPKGILLNRNSPSSASGSRKNAYWDPETSDPLAKLLKDAPRGSRRNALLKWCQNKLLSYKDVEVTNFSSSWNDGLAFCALVHCYLPNKIPFDQLDSRNKRRNFSLAFEAAESVGIQSTLSVDEMVALERPDWQAVMAYVTMIYKHFEA